MTTSMLLILGDRYVCKAGGMLNVYVTLTPSGNVGILNRNDGLYVLRLLPFAIYVYRADANRLVFVGEWSASWMM